MYNEEDFISEDPFNSKINEFIEEEVNNRVSDIKIQLEDSEKKLIKTKNKLNKIEKENEKLNKLKSQIEMFKVFKELIDENNFFNFASFVNLKSNNIGITGMESEDIPNWFKLLFKYYEDKEKLFILMDMFNIEYPSWAKEYKMPYDYNEEELLLFADLKKYDRYVTNGCIFEGNIGFFWRNIRSNKGKTRDILTSKYAFDSAIPWQLILLNPLWTKENIFNKIIENLKKKQRDSYYFFVIQNYIKISDEQIKEMAKLLPKDNFYDVHKKFIEINKNILKIIPELAIKYKDKINDNHYSSFYYLNYPIENQIKFIKNYNQDRGIYKRFDLIKNMDITKEEKLKLINEIANIELEKVS